MHIHIIQPYPQLILLDVVEASQRDDLSLRFFVRTNHASTEYLLQEALGILDVPGAWEADRGLGLDPQFCPWDFLKINLANHFASLA